ncbi:HET-domain-containing protein [Mycena venus]|uniref:HET-domain-containing protein n=1 Tax=Mycena venus TaxID=2733690 RepID=A0A8H6XR16_9AGAR|nr:HET-domain-containing protein [Mycena venus]
MSRQGNESKTVNNYIFFGGKGGKGGEGGVKGGGGGAGEGPTVNYKINTENFTTNILIEDLGKWLEFPPDTKDRQYHLRSLHHKATGRWLLHEDRFIKWKATPGSLWIKGISGTGKSVLSSTVIEEITVACPERSAVAYFYFDFSNERKHMAIMLRSIIWQLSRRSPLPYSALHRLYKTLGNGTIQPQHIYLQGVLEDLLSELDQTYIIIDGLDECDKTDWKLLIQFICSLRHPTKNPPHLLFTSQPLEEFQKAFKDVTFIELGSVVSTSDIRSFVSSEVPGIGNWASDDKYAKDVTEQIVQKSNGMFRMAACLLIELGGCHWEDNWEETLTALPADLFGIYGGFLTRAKGSLPAVFIQAIFRWLVFSARQVTLDELADAIAFRLSDPEFDFSDSAKSIYHPNRRRGNSDSFKFLEGLIVIKNDGAGRPSITLAHSSVKDYILSPEFQREFGTIIDLTKDVSHKFIAQTCLRHLLLFADTNHSMTKDTLPDYPISLYAAEYWLHHLRLCNYQTQEALLPLTMHLLEDGSSQHVALYQLRHFAQYGTQPPKMAGLRCILHCGRVTLDVAQLLIEHGASVDQVTKGGRTALHLASGEGHLDFARLLIEHGASVDQTTKDGRTALHLTLEEGHLDVAWLLIEHGASIDQANKDGWTVLHLALWEGHLDVAWLLIEHGASVDQATKDGWTALHLASKGGWLDVVQLLIKHNASINQATKDGRTALHFALWEGHLAIAQLLIEHSTSVNQATQDGRTALHFASGEGWLDVVQLLIEHNISVDRATEDGRIALHLASEKGHLNVAQLLIKHGTSVGWAAKYGQTALHLASEKGHLDVTQLLIEHSASIDQATEYGQTALHLASEEGHLDIAWLLIKHGASVDQATKDGWTTLHFASWEGHLGIARLLIEHGASVDKATKNGRTALHFASKGHHLDVARLLIEHGASIDQATKDGRTALCLALEEGHLDVARLLIEHDASVDQATKNGRIALHFALWEGHLDVARLLIEHGVSIDQATKAGRTALHLASEKGHLDIVQLLIEHGASVNQATKSGRTALHLASKKGHLNVVGLLIEHGASVDIRKDLL